MGDISDIYNQTLFELVVLHLLLYEHFERGTFGDATTAPSDTESTEPVPISRTLAEKQQFVLSLGVRGITCDEHGLCFSKDAPGLHSRIARRVQTMFDEFVAGNPPGELNIAKELRIERIVKYYLEDKEWNHIFSIERFEKLSRKRQEVVRAVLREYEEKMARGELSDPAHPQGQGEGQGKAVAKNDYDVPFPPMQLGSAMSKLRLEEQHGTQEVDAADTECEESIPSDKRPETPHPCLDHLKRLLEEDEARERKVSS